MKRTPLKRKTPLKAKTGLKTRTPMKKRSAKRSQVEAHDNRWSKAVRKACGEKCFLCVDTYDLVAHHIWGKQPFPEWRYVLENGVALCPIHHSNVHAHADAMNSLMRELGADELRAEFMGGVGTIIP